MNGELSNKGKKRKYTGSDIKLEVSESYEERDSEILCPICFQLINSAYITECGHSFCKQCIEKAFESMKRCPKCAQSQTTMNIFPNFALDEMIKKKRQKNRVMQQSAYSELLEHLPESSSLTQVDALLTLLQQRKQILLVDEAYGQSLILKEFLLSLKNNKTKELERLQNQISTIDNDLKTAQKETNVAISNLPQLPSASGSETLTRRLPDCGPTMRSRLSAHYKELEEYYIESRCPEPVISSTQTSLERVQSVLSKYVKYQGFKQVAKLSYTSDMYKTYSIVSSIEFDKDSDFFAIAGVTKKIKVYDYNQVISDSIDVHCPVTEMSSTSKISCLAWSSYHKSELASSDYDGKVVLWDPFAAKLIRNFHEHEKRCWCVDFNKQNPQLLASGSDDSRVKIWSTKCAQSVISIETKANVCCVKFNPSSSYHLAFGSADHCVHYYDLRQLREPLLTFKGHQKAVSYAKFLNSEEIVSASTDSQLKLWNVKGGNTAVRTFTGHTNEKNFVGLSSDADYIACGSEDNSLCVYYKGLSRVLLKYKFDVSRSAWQKAGDKEDENTEFVSAVTWVPKTNSLIAANSQGIIKLLELV